jgi:hypothetical protein
MIYTISITQVSDALTLGHNDIVETLIELSKEVIKRGGKVVLQYEYVNAKPDKVKEFITTQEVDDWKNEINSSQRKLERDVIN